MKLNLNFKLSFLSSNFAVTLGYPNPALNNSALNEILCYQKLILLVAFLDKWS